MRGRPVTRNIYIKEPLLIHFESKSRGYDDKAAKSLFWREARYARQHHNDLFKDDPYYSPNLCLQRVNELAFPPRRCETLAHSAAQSGTFEDTHPQLYDRHWAWSCGCH